ncbi:MAG: response regulator transcription factor [Dysgonamonadaceae bacterium]|nr:response regulator transcription factor [Dysgonamonadaceae bacterium]MDD4727363.1 response regulator transcription factor [Dysgonamonadaceae bacterium]
MEEKILIADDHSVVRLGLSMIIKKLRPHAVVEQVKDYKEVMHIIKEKTFSLAILDLNMPNGNFQEALQAIKIKYPETKVMIFSSQDESLYAVRYLKMGADGFLHKDSGEDVINRALVKMLDQGRYMSEEVKDSLIYDKLNKQDAPNNPLKLLSEREMEIAERMVSGDAPKEISNSLNIHASTVSTYKSRIFEKLNIQSIPELIKIFNFHNISKD